jgi:DNA-binding NtrC family response regulator
MRLPILIVDQDRARSALVVRALAEGFDCVLVEDFDAAYGTLARGDFWAALVAYSFDREGSGLELMQGLRELAPRTFRLLYSTKYSHGLVRDATRLVRAHAVLDASSEGFVTALGDTLQQLLVTLEAPVVELGAAPASTELPPWRAVAKVTRLFLEELRHAAVSDSPVFLHGEPGCGKHLAALSLQRWRRGYKAHQRTRDEAPSGKVGTVVMNVPPLRERIQDLPLLAEDTLLEFVAKTGGPAPQLTPAALEDLMHREWRGNVRELQVVLSRAAPLALRAGRREILVEDLAGSMVALRSPSQYAKDEGQLDTVLRQLRAAGSVRGAAKLERVPRANYMRLMRRLGVIRADAQPYGEDEA